MMLDTIMKCAFSYQGSVQLDRSVTTLHMQGPYSYQLMGLTKETCGAYRMFISTKSKILSPASGKF